MSDSSSLSSNNPRSDQGYHCRLGGIQGNCLEAKRQGAKGARDGKKGGVASKGTRKAGTNFKQNLLLVTQFRVYEDVATIIAQCSDVEFPDGAVPVLLGFIYGVFHSLPKARVREVIPLGL